MHRTFSAQPNHVNIAIKDVMKFGLVHRIRAEHASVSTQTVHLDYEEFNRIRPMLEAQGIEVELKRSYTSGRHTRRRMPYHPNLVIRPIAHGDFILVRSGKIGIVIKTAKGLVLRGQNMILNDFTRWAERRVGRNDVDDVLRTNLETWYLKRNEAPTVKVEVGIYADEEPDRNLAAYLLQRRAEVREEINMHGLHLPGDSARGSHP